KIHHPLHFTPVFFHAHHLLAWPQAHIHFAVDAARMCGRRLQIFLETAKLEQIEELAGEVLRLRPYTKRSVVLCLRAKPRSDVNAREGVAEGHPDIRGHAQTK